MDSERVSRSESVTAGRGGGSVSRPSLPFTYTEKFNELFPYYLAIGMTYEQYWDGDCALVADYRRAQEIRNDMENQRLWLQGMYVYEAICCVAPVLRPLSKAKKPLRYRAEPYPMRETAHQKSERIIEEKQDEKAKSVMEMFMTQFNKRFEKKGG